jgi:hypothetical protein
MMKDRLRVKGLVTVLKIRIHADFQYWSFATQNSI